MTTLTESSQHSQHNQTSYMLMDLGIAVHRLGYKQLCIAIPYYAQHTVLSLTKDLYPYVAKQFDCSDWRNVERTMRTVICDAWASRDSAVWDQYFPNFTKVPSNKQFISILAEYFE